MKKIIVLGPGLLKNQLRMRLKQHFSKVCTITRDNIELNSIKQSFHDFLRFDNQEENSEILKELINKGDDKLVFGDEIPNFEGIYSRDQNMPKT